MVLKSMMMKISLRTQSSIGLEIWFFGDGKMVYSTAATIEMKSDIEMNRNI